MKPSHRLLMLWAVIIACLLFIASTSRSSPYIGTFAFTNVDGTTATGSFQYDDAWEHATLTTVEMNAPLAGRVGNTSIHTVMTRRSYGWDMIALTRGGGAIHFNAYNDGRFSVWNPTTCATMSGTWTWTPTGTGDAPEPAWIIVAGIATLAVAGRRRAA